MIDSAVYNPVRVALRDKAPRLDANMRAQMASPARFRRRSTPLGRRIAKLRAQVLRDGGRLLSLEEISASLRDDWNEPE